MSQPGDRLVAAARVLIVAALSLLALAIAAEVVAVGIAVARMAGAGGTSHFSDALVPAGVRVVEAAVAAALLSLACGGAAAVRRRAGRSTAVVVRYDGRVDFAPAVYPALRSATARPGRVEVELAEGWVVLADIEAADAASGGAARHSTELLPAAGRDRAALSASAAKARPQTERLLAAVLEAADLAVWP